MNVLRTCGRLCIKQLYLWCFRLTYCIPYCVLIKRNAYETLTPSVDMQYLRGNSWSRLLCDSCWYKNVYWIQHFDPWSLENSSNVSLCVSSLTAFHFQSLVRFVPFLPTRGSSDWICRGTVKQVRVQIRVFCAHRNWQLCFLDALERRSVCWLRQDFKQTLELFKRI